LRKRTRLDIRCVVPSERVSRDKGTLRCESCEFTERVSGAPEKPLSVRAAASLRSLLFRTNFCHVVITSIQVRFEAAAGSPYSPHRFARSFLERIFTRVVITSVQVTFEAAAGNSSPRRSVEPPTSTPHRFARSFWNEFHSRGGYRAARFFLASQGGSKKKAAGKHLWELVVDAAEVRGKSEAVRLRLTGSRGRTRSLAR
jgi:hypothetical protein